LEFSELVKGAARTEELGAKGLRLSGFGEGEGAEEELAGAQQELGGLRGEESVRKRLRG